jgi:O-antigen/teichoic acid export membrane protein
MRRNTARNVVWNYAGYIYQTGINLALTSYIVRHLAVAEYGLFLFVVSLSATLYLLDMGISYLLVQAYVAAVEKAETDRLNDLLSTAFVALTAFGSVGVVSFAVLAALLPGPFNIPHEYLSEASFIFVIAALVMQVSLPSIALEQIYQASHRFDRINQIQLVTSTVSMILSIAVIGAGFHVAALALVQLMAALLQLLLFVIALPASVPQVRLSLMRFKWNLLKPLIRLSRWALVHNLSMYALDFLTWTILGSLGSMKEAAMFGLASKLPRQLWNMVDKGANVLLPLLSKFSAEADHINLQKTYLKAQKLILGAIIPFVVLGCLFARPLLQVWAGTEYRSATVVMQWLLLSAFAHAAGYSSDELLYACGQAKKSALISLSGGIAIVASALFLIPRFGAAGLAAGMALTQLLTNCGWFTSESCKLTHTSPRVFLRTVLGGLTWPLVVLAAEILLIWTIWSHLSSLWLMIAATISGCVYLVLWAVYTALPLYRNQTEIVA